MDRERIESVMFVVIVVVFAACVSACGATEDQLRTRAAFDMKCTDAPLQVVEIDDRTRGVIGCGQRNTYVESCTRYGQTTGKTGCTWVLNGSSP